MHLVAPLVYVAFELLRMRIETVSKRDAEALPPKKPSAPSVERGPRPALPPLVLPGQAFISAPLSNSGARRSACRRTNHISCAG
jgi:hypothetical protein